MTFREIEELLITKRYDSVHKLIWDGFAIVTDRNGYRYKLEGGMDAADVTGLLNAILIRSTDTFYYKKYRI